MATEDDAGTIKRQSQEFSDASATGDAKLFEKYLDDNVVFMDESGSITTKREIVEGASPPAKSWDSTHGARVTTFTSIATPESRPAGGDQGEDGAGNRSRTCDPRITNALLYQLS